VKAGELATEGKKKYIYIYIYMLRLQRCKKNLVARHKWLTPVILTLHKKGLVEWLKV
jgi:hypothetical protein